jgi:hypothetical protein
MNNAIHALSRPQTFKYGHKYAQLSSLIAKLFLYLAFERGAVGDVLGAQSAAGVLLAVIVQIQFLARLQIQIL